MEPHAKVLVLGNEPEASELSGHLRPGVDVTKVVTVSRAIEMLVRGRYDAVFCQWECSGGTWRAVMEEIHNRQLQVPIIVFCHCGGESDWLEALNAGAFDLLAPPYDTHEVNAVLEHALASRYVRRVELPNAVNV